MLNIDLTFFWTAVNLLILYLFANKFLFKRVGSFMEQRSASITSDIKKGEDLKAEGEEFRKKHETLLNETLSERNQILDEAHQKAVKEYENILAEAKKEAARIIVDAQEAAEREREKKLISLKNEVASMALVAASKVIEVNMDNDKNRALIESFLEREEAV